MASFLRPMLDYDPQHRATADQMLNHPWVRIRKRGNSSVAVDPAATAVLMPLSTPRDSFAEMKPLASNCSSDLDPTRSRSLMEEGYDQDYECPRY